MLPSLNMSVCTKRVIPVAGGYRFEVRCGGEIVACGTRSTRELAETAAAREAAVYEQVAGGGGGAKARGTVRARKRGATPRSRRR
jgi:hypothetical protein